VNLRHGITPSFDGCSPFCWHFIYGYIWEVDGLVKIWWFYILDAEY
jgi:hypothetical protein